ncbi:MAG: HAD family hydrolase [Acidimicrobiia bacterium]|nr:HAD family hydrolase [Acidimicrobiia bacterium]
MIIGAGDARFDVDAVIFDKDGTLIDLLASWSPAGQAWIEVASGGDAELAEELGNVIGVHNGEVVANGLLAAGTMGQLQSETRAVLEHHGIVNVADRIARARELAARTTNEHLTPIGSVADTLQRLVAAGLKIGVVTSDDRGATLVGLDRLGISELVGVIVAGDDGVAPKPSPEPLRLGAAVLGVSIERTLYVGDSNVDREAALSAPTAGFVLVAGAAQKTRQPGVDAIVNSIDELVIGTDSD